MSELKEGETMKIKKLLAYAILSVPLFALAYWLYVNEDVRFIVFACLASVVVTWTLGWAIEEVWPI